MRSIPYPLDNPSEHKCNSNGNFLISLTSSSFPKSKLTQTGTYNPERYSVEAAFGVQDKKFVCLSLRLARVGMSWEFIINLSDFPC